MTFMVMIKNPTKYYKSGVSHSWNKQSQFFVTAAQSIRIWVNSSSVMHTSYRGYDVHLTAFIDREHQDRYLLYSPTRMEESRSQCERC